MRKSGFRLTDRDETIGEAVGLSAHSIDQIARRFFSSQTRASRRMLQLHQAGIVSRVARLTSPGSGRLAFAYLAKGKKPRNLEHELLMTEVSITLAEAVGNVQVLEHKFLFPGQYASASGLRDHSLIPDALWLLTHRELNKTLLHLVELDRSTQSVQERSGQYSIQLKLERVASYLESGAYKSDWGEELQGFRLLLLVPDEKRMESILRVSKEMDFVWLSVTERFLDDPLQGSVWSHGRCEGVPLLRNI